MRITLIALFVTVAGPAFAEPQYEIGYARGTLGYEALVSNNNVQALEQLARYSAVSKNDPAKLINIGRAYARLGDRTRAEQAFIAALNCKDELDLVLADGREMGSRKAAKLALKQLQTPQE